MASQYATREEEQGALPIVVPDEVAVDPDDRPIFVEAVEAAGEETITEPSGEPTPLPETAPPGEAVSGVDEGSVPSDAPAEAPEPPAIEPEPVAEQDTSTPWSAQQIELARLRMQQKITQVEQEVAEYERGLVEDGLDPDAAKRRAAQHRDAYRSGLEFDAKQILAQSFASTYGVPVARMLEFGTPQEMQAAGEIHRARTEINKQVSSLQAENARLKAQLAAQKQAEVPAQSFDSGQSTSNELDGAALERAVGLGQVALTPDVAKRLTAYQKSQGFGG